MSKRFLETSIWDKRWIRLLKTNHKLFWLYILCKCDHAGMWEADIDLASFQLGIELNKEELLFVFKDKIQEVDDGTKWFIPGFILFQYGVLNPSNKVHNSVLLLLQRYKIQAPCIALESITQDAMEKDKEKEKDKATYKEMDKEFDKLWKKYPRKKGKERARVHFHAQVRTEEDLININKALDNYITEIDRMGVDEKHTKHGSTWFNNDWKDDIDYVPPKQPSKSQQNYTGKEETDLAESKRIFKKHLLKEG